MLKGLPRAFDSGIAGVYAIIVCYVEDTLTALDMRRGGP